MNVILILLIACINIMLICCSMEDINEEEIQFKSTQTRFNQLENSTFYLPCYLQNMENTITVWYRNGQKLLSTENPTVESLSNVKFQQNYTLKISSIKRTDSGEYSCHIILPERNVTVKQNHVVNVFFPPSVYPEPSSGALEVELDQGFVLTCDVTGNPQPKLQWFFENKEIPLQNKHTVILNVTKANKDHAGEYRCVANNSIGEPAVAIFHIRILYYPQLTVENNWIHSAIGERAELICNVSANPRPKVDWFHEGLLVNFSSRISTRIYGERYILTIKNMKYSDFGNYTCQGTNFLGRSVKNIQISGLANLAVFKQDPRIRTETTYTLIWEVDSYSPIIHYNLRFRKQQRIDIEGHWIQLIIPAAYSFMSPIHAETYTLTGLEPATVYEAAISSKNEFGWSNLSNIFKFASVGIDFDEIRQIDEEERFNKTSTGSTASINEINSEENPSWLTDSASIHQLKVSFTVLTTAYICRYFFL